MSQTVITCDCGSAKVASCHELCVCVVFFTTYVTLSCRWELPPEVFLGILYAKEYAYHIPLFWTTRMFWVIFCCLLGKTNWEIIT